MRGTRVKALRRKVAQYRASGVLPYVWRRVKSAGDASADFIGRAEMEPPAESKRWGIPRAVRRAAIRRVSR